MWKYTKVPTGAYLAGIYNHQRKLEALVKRMAGDGSAISNAAFYATSVKFQIRCDADGLDFHIGGNEYLIDEPKYRNVKTDLFENPMNKPVSVAVNGVLAINIYSVMGTVFGTASRGDKFNLLGQIFSFLNKSGEIRSEETEIHVSTPDGIKIHKYDSTFNDSENRREILNFKAECRNAVGRWSD